MFYSKLGNGFFTTEIHGEAIPADKVEITEEYWRELLDGQSNGSEIVADENGYPILQIPVVAPELFAQQDSTKAHRQSGIDKLIALGLTAEEITALGIRS